MLERWHLFNVAAFSLNHRLDTDPELGACLFHKHRRELGEYSADGGDQAGLGVVGGLVGDVLDVWSIRRRRGASDRRVQSRGTPSEAKPESLWTFGPAPSQAATPRVCHLHIQVHFGVDFQADFEDVRWHDVALTWNHTKDHNRSRKLCFHHPGHVPVMRGNPDLHFEGAGNGPVVITWIGREHELYSGASPILLVEHCVTFRHDRRLLSLLGFVHNWPTSRWSATKNENRVSLNGNGIMSFLGREFISPPCRWDCWIHQLYLCRGQDPSPPRVSCISHKTIWSWGSSIGDLGDVEW